MVFASLRPWLGATKNRRGTTAMETEENRSKSQEHTRMTRTMRQIGQSVGRPLLGNQP
jgi:hypothetical protein